MSHSTPAIRKFNPGTFQSDKEVVRQFKVRRQELDAALEVLGDNIDAESCQHILLVAPRGRGKTMLLARIAAELRANPAYRDKLLPVRFMEESHEVFHVGDFWMDALYYLAKECVSTEPDLARVLEGVHASLAKDWRDSMLIHRARAAVLDAADRLDRQLVLMVENLQTLSDDVDEDFGWSLRESLQMEPKVILLGTATSRFRALDDAREAFFELFYIMTLESLDTNECRTLWEAVTRKPVQRRDMRPLEILTGGSPRLLVIVADFARHRSFRQLLEELVTLVDDHTEYFRNQLEGLPKTERRVYLAALDLWCPSTTGEIAARARMGVRTTSSMLGRLVDRGALTVEGSARRRRYAATERLYCMYYKIRRDRDEAAVVQALIRFMTLYYSDRRSADDVRRALADEVARAPNILEGMVRALREDARVGLFAPEAALVAYDSMIETYREGSAGDGSVGLALAMMNKAALQFNHDKDREAFLTHKELITRFGDSRDPEMMRIVAGAYFNVGVVWQERQDARKAIVAYDEVAARYADDSLVETQEIVLSAQSNKASVLSGQKRYQEAVDIYCDIATRVRASGVPELQWHRARAFVNMGATQAELEQWDAAVDTWKCTVREFGNSDDVRTARSVAGALYRIGCVQLLHEQSEPAVRTMKKVQARYGMSSDEEIREIVAHSFTVQGDALERLNRQHEALAVHREQQERFGDVVDSAGVSMEWRAILGKTRILLSHGEDGATDARREAIQELCAATNMESDENLKEMYAWIVAFGAFGKIGPNDLADLLASDKERSKACWPLVVALKRVAGEEVRAPIEVMEVADDLLEQMKILMKGLNAGVDAFQDSGEIPASVGQSLLETVPKLAANAGRLAAT